MSAVNGYAEAQTALGECYASGIGVPKDSGKAIQWWTKAAEQDSVIAQTKLGAYYLSKVEDAISANDDKARVNNLESAVKWLKGAAEKGNADAQYYLGKCYSHDDVGAFATATAVYFGLIEREDESKVGECYWYRKAALQGQREAQYEMGMYCNYTGEYEQSVYWLKKAAEQGHAQAQYKLADYYFAGVGVDKDSDKAIYWLTKSAEQGDVWAQYGLANCYLDGKDVRKDGAKAVYWLTKSADGGYAQAQYALASLYYLGELVPKDDNKCYHYLKLLPLKATQGQ